MLSKRSSEIKALKSSEISENPESKTLSEILFDFIDQNRKSLRQTTVSQKIPSLRSIESVLYDWSDKRASVLDDASNPYLINTLDITQKNYSPSDINHFLSNLVLWKILTKESVNIINGETTSIANDNEYHLNCDNEKLKEFMKISYVANLDGAKVSESLINDPKTENVLTYQKYRRLSIMTTHFYNHSAQIAYLLSYYTDNESEMKNSLLNAKYQFEKALSSIKKIDSVKAIKDHYSIIFRTIRTNYRLYRNVYGKNNSIQRKLLDESSDRLDKLELKRYLLDSYSKVAINRLKELLLSEKFKKTPNSDLTTKISTYVSFMEVIDKLENLKEFEKGNSNYKINTNHFDEANDINRTNNHSNDHGANIKNSKDSKSNLEIILESKNYPFIDQNIIISSNNMTYALYSLIKNENSKISSGYISSHDNSFLNDDLFKKYNKSYETLKTIDSIMKHHSIPIRQNYLIMMSNMSNILFKISNNEKYDLDSVNYQHRILDLTLLPNSLSSKKFIFNTFYAMMVLSEELGFHYLTKYKSIKSRESNSTNKGNLKSIIKQKNEWFKKTIAYGERAIRVGGIDETNLVKVYSRISNIYIMNSNHIDKKRIMLKKAKKYLGKAISIYQEHHNLIESEKLSKLIHQYNTIKYKLGDHSLKS
ncbi:MAG: hypothetical protein GWP09_02975 [Nitrospiraceae bacterium]|nr:hypothetical protein [Nitrospiraceae bacterium]